jgi:hypothetical protein
MKISKKDLRKIIFENIAIKEQTTQSTAAGAKRSKEGSDSTTQQSLLGDAEAFVEAVVDPIVKNLQYFTAKINIGRILISLNNVNGRSAEGKDLDKEEIKDLQRMIKAALKNDSDIAALKGMLKVGRRIKVNYKKDGEGSKSKAQEEIVNPTPDPRTQRGAGPSPDPSPAPSQDPCDDVLIEKTGPLDLAGNNGSGVLKPGATVSNGFVYQAKSPYLYYVSTANGCWYALNKNTCKFFSMKKYPDNMKNLDDKFPNARSQDLRDRCAGKGTTPDPRVEPLITPKTPGNVGAGEAAIIYLMAAGTGRTLSQLGPTLVTLYKKGDTPAYKEVISQVKRATPSLPSLSTAAMKFVTPKSVGGLLDLSGVQSAALNTPDAFNAYAKKNGMGTALKLVLSQGAAFDLKGFDEASDNKSLMPDLKDALGKYFSAPGGTLNESFGKSRGTLLRERYWGRY